MHYGGDRCLNAEDMTALPGRGTRPSRTHRDTQTENAKSYSLMARSDMEGRTCMHKHRQSGSAAVKARFNLKETTNRALCHLSFFRPCSKIRAHIEQNWNSVKLGFRARGSALVSLLGNNDVEILLSNLCYYRSS